MPTFLYKAIDYNGTMVKGSIEAMDTEAASVTLSHRGLSILELKKASELLASLRKQYLARTVKRKDIIEFANNISVMIKTGIPLVTSLYDIAESTENVYLKKNIQGIAQLVEYGSMFSDAVAFHKDIFPDVFLHLVVVGEETGRLDKSLADVAMHLKKMDELAEAIKSAVMYPSFAIITTTGALLFWLKFVLPETMSMFKGMSATLPLPTRILIEISNFTESYWYLIIMMPVLFIVIFMVLNRREKSRYYIDMVKIRMPVMKHIVYNKLLALYAEQMRILSVAGITITRSMDIVAKIIGNEVFRVAIEGSLQDISAGSGIAEAMKKRKVFPTMMTRMVSIGESSGSLDEQFGYLSEYYMKRLDDVAQRIGKMIEPIVIVVIGLMFVFMIMGLLMPIYDLVTKMK